MREDDRIGVSETRPDRHYRMPPCPNDSQLGSHALRRVRIEILFEL